MISETLLRPLAQAQSQVLLSNKLQIADVLEWILEQAPDSCSIIQTSFSISEEFLRRMYHIKKNFSVSYIGLVLDLKATNKTVTLLPFINAVYDKAALCSNHSKVLLVQCKGFAVSVLTSQNLTRGNRVESYSISTDPDIFKSIHDYVLNMIKYHSLPINDILGSGNCSD